MSLAKMGLIAIPNKDIGDQDEVDDDDQIAQKDAQFRMNFRQGEEVTVGEVVSQDVKNNNHNNHNHRNKNQWVHDLVGPQGPVGLVGKLEIPSQILNIVAP